MASIQEKLDKIKAPSSVGRMPKKIGNSYGGFTADQWKTFTVLFSIFALHNVLPAPDLELWRYFVLGCMYICSPVITQTKAMLANSCLLNFCKGFEQLYGEHRVTPNMHLHTHLVDCILDYGPVYSFWLFSFERYNGIIGDYGTNQRSVEIQLMRKFTSDQCVKDIQLPVGFQKYFKPVMERQTGSLQDHCSSEENIPRNLIMSRLLSVGPVQRGLVWTKENSYFVCCGPHSRDTLCAEFLPHLRECYNAMFDTVDEAPITAPFNRYSSCKCSAQIYGSSLSRGDRSSFVLARWCALGGKIDSSGADLRPGIIDFFIEQNIKINGQIVCCLLAGVRWLQSHPLRHAIGAPVDVWCKDLYELEGGASFVPVQRLHGKFIPAFDIIQHEHVYSSLSCPTQTPLLVIVIFKTKFSH